MVTPDPLAPGWQDEIQRNSIELEPGLYGIRSGGVDLNRAIDTPI